MPDPYLSEIKYLGSATQDFVEIAVDAGADVSNLVVTIYHSNGTVRSTNSLFGQNHTTVNGKDVYVVESGAPSTFTGLHKHGGVALSENGTVYEFVSFSDNAATITATQGDASGLTSIDIGQAGAGSSLETTDGGDSYALQTTPNSGSIPCLTKGTRIQTYDGEVKVEDLQPGMRLLTVEGTYVPLRIVLSTLVSREEHLQDARLAPIRITAGALGQGLPKVDLLVSRQHRMLVSSCIAKKMFEETSVLVAAVRLTVLSGIYVDTSVDDVEYFHLILDQHRVIFAESAPTESLFVGQCAMSMLSEDAIEEIRLLFPAISQPDHSYEPAYLIPDRKRQKRLLERHAKNAREPLHNFRPPLHTTPSSVLSRAA